MKEIELVKGVVDSIRIVAKHGKPNANNTENQT